MSTPDEPQPPPERRPWEPPELRPRLTPEPRQPGSGPKTRETPETPETPESPETPTTRKNADPALRWAAIGAIATAIAALVTVLAYVVPRSPAAPAAATAPASSYSAPAPVPTTPSPTTQSPTTPAPAPPPATTTAPAPSPSATAPAAGLASIQAGTPAGCDDAFAAINTYKQTAGSTTNSENNAAEEAYQSLSAAYFVANGDSVSGDINSLAGDFDQMTWILSGQTAVPYSAAVQQTNSDIQTLNAACQAG